MKNKVVKKLQHHVFFVHSLEVSKQFYMDVLDINFSADNSPTTSAAMYLIGQSMNFYSFGKYHHDICLVHNPKFKMVPDDDMLHVTFKLNPSKKLVHLKEKLQQKNISFKEGRILQSQNQAVNAIHFKDPSGNVLEIIE